MSLGIFTLLTKRKNVASNIGPQPIRSQIEREGNVSPINHFGSRSSWPRSFQFASRANRGKLFRRGLKLFPRVNFFFAVGGGRQALWRFHWVKMKKVRDKGSLSSLASAGGFEIFCMSMLVVKLIFSPSFVLASSPSGAWLVRRAQLYELTIYIALLPTENSLSMLNTSWGIYFCLESSFCRRWAELCS